MYICICYVCMTCTRTYTTCVNIYIYIYISYIILPLTSGRLITAFGACKQMPGVCRRGVWERGVSNLWKLGFQREKRSPEFSRVRTAFAFGWVLSLWKPNFHTLETPRPQTPRLQTPDYSIRADRWPTGSATADNERADLEALLKAHFDGFQTGSGQTFYVLQKCHNLQ